MDKEEVEGFVKVVLDVVGLVTATFLVAVVVATLPFLVWSTGFGLPADSAGSTFLFAMLLLGTTFSSPTFDTPVPTGAALFLVDCKWVNIKGPNKSRDGKSLSHQQNKLTFM